MAKTQIEILSRNKSIKELESLEKKVNKNQLTFCKKYNNIQTKVLKILNTQKGR